MQDRKEIEGVDYSTYAGKAVAACRTKFRGLMGEDLLIPKLLDFVTLILLNNKFANVGIYITDDNKEECYIKIIELGDEKLINDLEKFISLRDSITKIEELKHEYETILTSLSLLQNKNDEETVNDIVRDYLRR